MVGASSATSPRHGGPEHRYWVRVLAEHLVAEGHVVAVEAPIGEGRTVDIIASRDGKRIAYEIETGTSDVSANIRKCREAGLDEIVVVFTSRKARERFARSSAALESVKVVTTAEFFQSES